MAKATTNGSRKKHGDFTPFQTGNQLASKSSHPRGRFITQRLIAMMHEEIYDPNVDPKDKLRERNTRLAYYCEKLFELAFQGDMQALKFIADRIEGSAISTVAFVPQDETDKQALEFARLTKTHERIKDADVGQLAQLYAETLRAGTPTHGSA
jgi:hypothetical protein